MSSNTKPKYKKLDQIEHVLKRSDMYVGSSKSKVSEEYIAEKIVDEETTKISYKIYKKKISYPPALLRIFIEGLSNAIDNVERSKKTNTKCTKISININKETGETIIWNDGDIIPIEINEDTGIYNHSMIFGYLLSGSNFDDDEERLVSGKNGVGITCANIFSKKFRVKGLDPINKKILTQEWTNNMRKTEEPNIKNTKLLKGYTEVSYIPDFEKFGIEGYTDDIISLYTKYIIDSSMLSGVKVFFNDIQIPVKTLSDYSKLYNCLTDEKLYIKTDTSEMLLTPCDEFQAISFVNGVFTKQGGQHVESWCEAIFRPILEKFNKKGKPSLNITNIKQHFRIFVVCTIDKPIFSSQEKERLESPSINVSVKPSHINSIIKWSVGEHIQDIIRSKEMLVLKKSEKKTRGYTKIEGLDPANYAGTKYSSECSLILCEGLSAKTYAVAGIEKGIYNKSGRNFYGILALKGKCLNCRNATSTMISNNAEITSIIKAIGLKHEVDYTIEDNFKQLNYGKVILMTDADSVTHDTPVLLKSNNGDITIMTIDSLCDNWEEDKLTGKFYGNTDYTVWTDKGWTKIKSVMKHKVSKTIFRVITPSGLVDVTEDHSLLKSNCQKISPKDCVIGQTLLHSFPNFKDKDKQTDYSVSQSYYKLGLSYRLDKTNESIPSFVFNGYKFLRESFFRGMRDSNIHTVIYSDYIFKISNKIVCQSVYLLCKSLGYEVFIDFIDTDNIFTLNVKKENNEQTEKNYNIKKIINLGNTEQYVYDLETDNHHFQAGIGKLIVHNTDGLHIQSLIMNFFHVLFPTILKRKESYLISLNTPIVRVFKKPKDLLFYDEKKFLKYVSEQTTKIDKKYYKGLGTTKPEDVPDTFGNKIVEYKMDEKTDINMNKVFHKKFADDRKKWLSDYDPNNYISLDDGGELIQMNISDFINGEMIKFSIYDCERNIPSLIDGQKKSQRKVLFSVKKKNLKYSGKSLKVAQLAGYVAEKTNYHHGEQNLYDTIVKMANDYVGSNNIPLLYRDGMFSTRLNGKDAASARYIYTKMDMLTHLIFRQEDDPILNYIVDDGDEVEPIFYVPIIPMILINGCTAALGTGWSCNIPNYNPTDIIKCIKIWLDNNNNIFSNNNGITSSLLPELIPWYKNFTGTIEQNGPNKFISKGIITDGKRSDKIVSELPIGLWTEKFKKNLEDLLEQKQIKNIKNFSTPKNVNFVLTPYPDALNLTINSLKLYSYIHTSNMVLFNDTCNLKKYEQVDEIIDEFCRIRYSFYQKRKIYILNELESQIKFLKNKERFISEIMNNTLSIMNTPEEDIIKDLENKKYDKINNENEDNIKGYDYLLKLQIRNFTTDKIDKLKKEISIKLEEFNNIQNTTEKQLWINELDEFEKEYIKFLKIN